MENISKEEFVLLIKDVFSEDVKPIIHFETNLPALVEWSSLQAMIVLSEIDRAYGIVLNALEMKAANTPKDLYELVVAKIN